MFNMAEESLTLLICLLILIGLEIENLEKVLSAWTLCLCFLGLINFFTKWQENINKWYIRIWNQPKNARYIHTHALLKRVSKRKMRLKWLGNCKYIPKKTIWTFAVPYYVEIDQDDRLRTSEGRLQTYLQDSPLSQEHARILANNGFWCTGGRGEVECFSCRSRHNAITMNDNSENLSKLHSPTCQHRIQYGQMLAIPHQPLQPDTGQIHRKEHENVFPTSQTTQSNKQQEDACFEWSKNVLTESQTVAEVISSTVTDVLYERVTSQACILETRQDGSASKIQSSENTDKYGIIPSAMVFAGASYKGPETRASNSELSANTCSSHQATTNMPGRNTNITHGVNYSFLENRNLSYQHWPKAGICNTVELAEAGFFFKGQGDIVKCFSCGGEVRNWQHGMDPWEEHNEWYPHCAFLAEQNKERLLNQKDQDGVLSNGVHGVSQEQGISEEIEDCEVIVRGITHAPIGTYTAELSSNLGQPIQSDDRICRMCKSRKSNILFEPCTHVVCCEICAPVVTKCMTCHMRIQVKTKVYL